MLGCSTESVMTYVRQGRLEGYRYSLSERGPVWVSLDSVEGFLAAARIQPDDLLMSESAA